MADSDKNIIITPNRGLSAQPEIYFGGSGGVPIRLKVLDDAYGTLSFEGSAGQLFSVNNNLTSGSIFSVNDVSGIPSIEVNADGTVTLAPYGGRVGIGLTAPNTTLHVGGTASASGFSGPLAGTATNASALGGTAAASWAQLASPTFTGTPAAPTPAVGTNTTQIATTAFVQNEIVADTVTTFNGQTGAVTGASLGANTFTGLNVFNAGISANQQSRFSSVFMDGITSSFYWQWNGVTQPANGSLNVNGGFSVTADVSSSILNNLTTFVWEKTAAGTAFHALYPYSAFPFIKTTQTNTRMFGVAYNGFFQRGSTEDFSSNTSNNFHGTQLQVGHDTNLPETAVSGGVRGALLIVANNSGQINTVDVLRLQNLVGTASTAKGVTTGTLYGIRNDNLTVGHISSGKPANVQNWYQIWLGQGITAGLGTIGSNRWAIYQTDPLNGNYFAGGISADRGATFGGQVVVFGTLSTNGGVSAAGATFSGKVISDGYRIGSAAIDVKTSGHTLAAVDDGKVLMFNSASALVINAGTAAGYTGFFCTVVQLGTGGVRFASSGGTVLNSYNGLTMAGQHASATVLCYQTNTFNVSGNMIV